VAFSAQKITPGSTCKVLKQKVDYLNKTYTCTKSGKKLTWNKGVAAKKATPTTTPTPTPTPIQISIDNLDLKGVPQKANDNVIKVLKSSPRANYEPTKFLGANVVQARVSQEIAGLERAIDFWAPYFQPNKFQVVYVMGGDEEWLETKSSELGLSSMLPRGDTWSMWMKKQNPCAVATAGSGKGVPTFVQCLGRPYEGGTRQTGPHEYTHLFQDYYGGTNHKRIPWYTEGSAIYFGWTLGFYPTDSNFNDRSNWFKSLYFNMNNESKDDFISKDMQRFKNRMKMLTPGSFDSVGRTSYWVGGLATEVLVALYGFDKFVEFTKNIQTNPDMSSLLKQTYGFDEDYFYEKLAPYVWAQLPA
jgi:hypothetical protein